MATLTVKIRSDIVERGLRTGNHQPGVVITAGLPSDAKLFHSEVDQYGSLVLRFNVGDGEDRTMPIAITTLNDI